ncbi:hypothetical protein [Helicobacter sp. T3_23-1056]
MAGSHQFPPQSNNGRVYSLHYDGVDFAYTPRARQGAYNVRDSKDFKQSTHLSRLHNNHANNECSKNAQNDFLGFFNATLWSGTKTHKECRAEYKHKIYYGYDYGGFDEKKKACGWREILEAYSLPNEPIAISEYDLWRVLERAAETYWKSCKKTASLSFWEHTIFIVTAIATIASVGTLAPITITGLAAFMGFVATGITWSVQSWNQYKIKQAEAITAKTASQIAEFEAKKLAKQRAQITNMLIYDSQAMFANGQAYNAQQAGSQTFSPTIAYDPNKALLGQQNQEFIDELTQNRNQVTLAGGVNFMSNLLEFDFPLASTEAIPKKDLIKAINQQYYEWQLRLNHCFEALAHNSFGVGFDENDKTINNIMQKAIKYHITARQKKIEELDAIDKLKNYNKGLRYECPMSINALSAQSSGTKSSYAVSEWERHTKAHILKEYKNSYNEWYASVDKSDNIKMGYSFYQFILKQVKIFSEINSLNDKTIARSRVATLNTSAKVYRLRDFITITKTDKIDGHTYYHFNLRLDEAMYKRIENLSPYMIYLFYDTFFSFSGYKYEQEEFNNPVYTPPNLPSWNLINNYHTRQQEYKIALEQYYKILDEYQIISATIDAKIDIAQKRIKITQAELESTIKSKTELESTLESKKAELKSTKDKTQKATLQQEINNLESNIQNLTTQINELESTLKTQQKMLEKYLKQDEIIIEMMNLPYTEIMKEYYEASLPTQATKQALQEAQTTFYELQARLKNLQDAESSQDSSQN